MSGLILKAYGVARFPNEPAITPCEDISIIGTPETLRSLGIFLLNCADKMASNGEKISEEWHMHLRDSSKEWNEEMIDVIVCPYIEE